jgi:pyruvate,water dikinase
MPSGDVGCAFELVLYRCSVTLVDLSDADADCGSKAHALGRLIRAGARVPAGFVVRGEPAGQAFARAVELLNGPLAVRSSSMLEDSDIASFAGQLETILGVVGVDEVAAAVARCSASAQTAHARAYATRVGVTPESRIPVIVQRLVPAHIAGVAFTRDPRSGAEVVVIEGAWGLGESVVAGRVVPDICTVTAGGTIEMSVGSKATRLDRHDGVVRRTAVATADRRRPCLTSEQAAQIAAAARQAEATFDAPVDIEWAIADDTLWLLQARPITTTFARQESRSDIPDEAVLARGIGASPGRASGAVRVVRDLGGFGLVEPGDVLVCRTTDPAWTALFGIVAAVVTETGGLLSHAAIVARELGIPAVVGVPGAMSHLLDSGHVAVDGARGIVLGTT